MSGNSVARTVGRPGRGSAPTGRTVRRDIQGLRALAVVAVILDHLLGWPSGGFVGVDVFFVLSGFLITGLLLREWERTQSISFAGFYRRRARRILPASIAVLGVTVAVAAATFSQARFLGIVGDAVAGLLFSANWRFALVGTDYFRADGPVSPLQHFWSLAVEEQFYFVWPWLMLLILRGTVKPAGRSSETARLLMAGVLLALTVASFGWALLSSSTDPTVAYFSTLTRTWELGAGALLALCAPVLAAVPRRLRPVLAWLGLLGIVASVLLLDDTLPFPAPWALAPVLSTVLAVAANTGADGPARLLWPLTNPVSAALGDISYSLYLWHFPIVVLGAALFTDHDAVFLGLSLLLILLVSVWSYHIVERPLHRSKLFERSPSHATISSRWRSWIGDNAVRYRIGLLTALVPLTALVVVSAYAPPPTVASAPVRTTAAPTATAALTPAIAALQEKLETAASATDWPTDLTPSLDDVIAVNPTPADLGACAGTVSPTSGTARGVTRTRRTPWSSSAIRSPSPCRPPCRDSPRTPVASGTR